MKIRIKFTKKRQNFNLFFGIAWAILGILKLISNEPMYGIDYAWLGLAGLSIGTFFYEYKNQYLTIKNGLIFKSYPFGKKMKLTDIKRIKKFAGDYILKTEYSELTINTQIIDEKSLHDLNSVLGKLDLPEDKTPFANNVYN